MQDIFDDYLDSMEALGDLPQDNAPTVCDDVSAESVLLRIAAERAESERLNATRRKMIDMYAQGIRDEEARCQRRCAHLEKLLSDYFATVPHKVTKTQQIYALPSGKLILKQPPTQYSRDDDALTAWLKSSGRDDLIEVKTSPKWGDLKKHGVRALGGGQCILADTGEIIDGVTAVTPDPVFQIQVTAKEG